MHVSVVVPTYNRRDLLQFGLRALANQRTPGFTYEVIVCDDGSSDGTQQMCLDMARQYPVPLRLLALPHVGGPSASRNEGTMAAGAPVVVYMDDDVVPDDDFVLRHYEFHHKYPDERVVAIGTSAYTRTRTYKPHDAVLRISIRTCSGTGKTRFYVLLDREYVTQARLYVALWIIPFQRPCKWRDAVFRRYRMRLSLDVAWTGSAFLPEARAQHYPTLRPEKVGAKGYGTGKGHFKVSQVIPDVAVPIRFGVLTWRIGLRRWMLLAAKRVLFRAVDNPLTHRILITMGARGTTRSRVTNLYYYLIFRRNMISGYNDEKRLHRKRQVAANKLHSNESKAAEGL